jgi:hypothetical protein
MLNAAELLTLAMADGLIVWPDGADTLRVCGPAAARAKWRGVLLQHKHSILRHLWVQRLRDYFLERAGLLERDARLPRHEALEQARSATALVACKLGAPWVAIREALDDPRLPDAGLPVSNIIRDAQADGLRLELSPVGTLRVTGRADAVHRWLPVLRERKAEIIEVLRPHRGAPKTVGPSR